MEEASIDNRGVRNGLAQAEGIWEDFLGEIISELRMTFFLLPLVSVRELFKHGDRVSLIFINLNQHIT